MLNRFELWGSRVVIPKPGQAAIVEELHGGHPGIVQKHWPEAMFGGQRAGVVSKALFPVSRDTQCSTPTHTWEWPRSWIHLDFVRP